MSASFELGSLNAASGSLSLFSLGDLVWNSVEFNFSMKYFFLISKSSGDNTELFSRKHLARCKN